MKNPRVKKAFIIASSAFVVIIVLIGLCLNFITFRPALIAHNEWEEILDNLSNDRSLNRLRWYHESAHYETVRCYGRENGYILVFVSGGDEYEFEYKYIADIDGVVFANPKHFSFYAYKDGKFIDITDAYEQGLISREVLLKAKVHHDQC